MKVLVFGKLRPRKRAHTPEPLRLGRAWRTSTWTRSSGSRVRLPCSAPVSLSQRLFEASSIRSLLGSLKAATANWCERLWLIARCWSSSTQGGMHAWQTISSGLGNHASTPRSSSKTPCLASFKSGWPVTINETMRGHTRSTVESSMPSRDQRWSIVRSMHMRPNNRFQPKAVPGR